VPDDPTNTPEPVPTPDPSPGTGGEPTPAPDPAPQPELLAGKYKTKEDLIDGYKAAQAKIAEQAEQLKAAQTPKIPETIDVSTVLKKINMTEAQVASQFQQHGKLSDEQYAALRAEGVPSQLADALIKVEIERAEIAAKNNLASEQMREAYRQTAFAICGGEEGYRTITEWGKMNLPESEWNVAASQIADSEQFVMALQNLKARKAVAEGTVGAGQMITGTAPPAKTGAQPFATKAELNKALTECQQSGISITKHPEYGPRFRATPTSVRFA
jgi:hypothetical protein